MLVPNRHGSNDPNGYRYGFNGMEKDNELKGDGNSINYEARMQDTRIGRFLSVDPLTKSFPHYSPYQFAGNTPIQAIDLDGAEEYDYRLIVKNGKAKLKLTNVKYFNHHSYFGGLIKFDTKISSRKYIVRHNNKIYHIGFAQYGVGYSNAWKVDEFENDYLSNKDNVDEIAFENNFYDDDVSKGTSLVAQSLNIQNTILENGNQRYIRKLLSKPCGCFTAGTQVLTESGYKNIEDVKIDEKVWAYDDATGNLALKEVINTFAREFTQVYKIYFGDEVLEATHEHPFFIGGKWLKVDELKTGDLLTLYDGSTKAISKIELVEGNFKVYNFTVDQFHTYFVSHENVLVHNGSPCDFIPVQLKKGIKGAKELNQEIKKIANGLGGTQRIDDDGAHKLFDVNRTPRNVKKTDNHYLFDGAMEYKVDVPGAPDDYRILYKNTIENGQVKEYFGYTYDHYTTIHLFQKK